MNNAALDRRRGSLRAILYTQLAQNILHVILHRVLAQKQLGADLAIGLALGDQRQDLPFLL